MRVAARHRNHLRGNRFGETIGELRAIGQKNLGHAADLCGFVRRIGGVVTRHKDVHVATGFCRRSHRVQRCRADRFTVMFGKHQSGHQITFASVFSFATSVAASGTLIPALRPAGSVTCSVFNLGVTSTPRSSGFRFSSGFFFAFMMLGSVT